jgi:hypothetical protein
MILKLKAKIAELIHNKGKPTLYAHLKKLVT